MINKIFYLIFNIMSQYIKEYCSAYMLVIIYTNFV